MQLEFQHQALLIETNNLSIEQFVLSIFDHLLSDSQSNPIAKFSAIQSQSEYELSQLIQGDSKLVFSTSQLDVFTTQLKYHLVTTLLENTSQFLWFHAAAAAKNNEAIWLLAPPGGGKSSIVLLLVQEGWQYLSDDVVALDLVTNQLIGFPQTPRPRKSINKWIQDKNQINSIAKEIVTIPIEKVQASPCEVKGIVFLKYHSESTIALEKLSSSQAVIKLLEQTINFPLHKQSAMNALVDLSAQTQAYQLDYDNRNAAFLALIQCFD
ncbi:hypothetical protein [[Leptolyngbya] sp. PCC 7376]|uniref:hypothetical protein n=1 Tax=[Leptolyngbya] sp. PCC 7376 TaxID=111781 RepID=UPI001359C6D2|nr:hypothetical protein [[Leptolyngbya] sp. PCC 7376]